MRARWPAGTKELTLLQRIGATWRPKIQRLLRSRPAGSFYSAPAGDGRVRHTQALAPLADSRRPRIPHLKRRTASGRGRRTSSTNWSRAGRRSLAPRTPWPTYSTAVQPRAATYRRKSCSWLSGGLVVRAGARATGRPRDSRRAVRAVVAPAVTGRQRGDQRDARDGDDVELAPPPWGASGESTLNCRFYGPGARDGRLVGGPRGPHQPIHVVVATRLDDRPADGSERFRLRVLGHVSRAR